MRKLLFAFPLFFLFFIPFDTFALEYKNPKIEMIGQQVGSDIESVIAGCEACSEIQNSSGIPHGIRIYFPDTLFADLDDVTITFNFRWVYNGQYDVWPRPPIMFHHNPAGTNTLADKFSVADWTYLDGYIQNGYWFRNHSVTVKFTHGLGNILSGYYYLDISFFENIYGSSVPYVLNYKIELDTIYITNSRYDEIGVIIDNAADRIIESNEINKHANQENFDKIQETIKDSNISGSQGFAKDFFNTFKDEDNHGISTIVKSPLVMIQSLISDSDSSRCSNLNFEILGSSVYFPSGCTFWSKVPDSVRSIYYLIICGFFGYKLVISLFKDTQRLKSPNNSEVTTLDL